MGKAHSPAVSGEGRKSPRRGGQRQFKGVRKRSWGSWVTEIRAPNQKTRIWLGSYSTPEAAARAYDAALLCLKGSSAALNFPSSYDHHQHPADTTLSPKSIQRIAAAAAADTSLSPPPQSPPSFSTSTTATDATAGSSGTVEEEISSPVAAGEPLLELLGDLQSPKCFMEPTLMESPISQFAVSYHAEEQFYDEIGDLNLWSFS